MRAISGDTVPNKPATFDGGTSVSAFFRLFTALVAATAVYALATQAHAQGLETASKASEVRLDLRSPPPNEIGFTLGDLFDKRIWNLVTNPLGLGVLRQVAAGTRQVPRPGVQLELLTPAAGVTLHFRW